MGSLAAIIGRSQKIHDLKALIGQIGPSNSTVLISGDSGTGKELIAKALHASSDRADQPFIPVNCGAIPRDLLESELFGHQKGSFTGAVSDRKGRFELANKGTIFLDEIGDMSLDLQVKLLRVLQERTIDPVGSNQVRSVDVRVIAASHKNLEALIAEEKFREDLYYRLNVLPIEACALKERLEDLQDLFDHFAKLYATNNIPPCSLHPSSLVTMTKYDWPGNVRELSNIVDRFTALYGGKQVDLRQVPPAMLPSGMRHLVEQEAGDALNKIMFDQESNLTQETAEHGSKADTLSDVERVVMLAQGVGELPGDGLHLKQHLVDIERSVIRQALEKSEGNVSKTARFLNIQRTTLIEKINKYDLTSNA